MLCTLTLYISAQQSGTLKKKEQDIELNKAFHLLNEGPVTLSESDLEIIAAYNFESYRKEDLRTKIQLVKGPLLELLSKKEMHNQAGMGKVFAADSKVNSVQENYDSYEIIVQLNIGLGYAKKQHEEVMH